MPEVEDDLEFQLPAPNVPTREGEERFQTGLNLEDQRRKDSMKAEIMAELRAQLKQLEGTTAEGLHLKPSASRAARQRQRQMRAKLEELTKLTFRRGDRWEGPCAPVTLINLNPIELHLHGEMQRWSVPSAGKGKHVINMSFRGRKFVGSYITFRTPHLWMVPTGTQTETAGGVGTPTTEVRYMPPAGVAHQFYSHYVEGASDAQYMGGILVFDGDIHTLEKARLDRRNRRVWVPKPELLEGMQETIYTLEEVALEDLMEKSLGTQQGYAGGRIAEGHSYATAQSDIQRNQLNGDHVIWHNFALECGYIEEPYDWATKKLVASPSKQAVFCPDCHNKQSDPDQYFCSNCNAPFDPFKAFMAGKVVSPDLLAMYDEDSEEWQAIIKESKRRKRRIAMLDEPVEEKSTKAAEGGETKPPKKDK